MTNTSNTSAYFDTYIPEYITNFDVVKIISNNKTLELIQVTLNKEEKLAGELIAKNMGANSKGITNNNKTELQNASFDQQKNIRGNYNAGILNTEKNPHRTETIGRWGEIALAKILHLTVDAKYRKNGDNHDFIINNITCDIKTASRRLNEKIIYKDNQTITLRGDVALIQGKNHKGHYTPLDKDYYFFAYLYKENNDNIIVNIVGGIKKENINPELIPSRIENSNHKNYEVPYSDNKLNPIKNIIIKIHSKLENQIAFNYIN